MSLDSRSSGQWAATLDPEARNAPEPGKQARATPVVQRSVATDRVQMMPAAGADAESAFETSDPFALQRVEDEELDEDAEQEAETATASSSSSSTAAARPAGAGGTAVVQRQAQPRAEARRPGGRDPLGRKENMLLQWRTEFIDVAAQLHDEFVPFGLEFRPQILLATAMQEAAARDPLNAVSFDNGLGIMQITPYRGRLDPDVARAIGWDNRRSVAANIRSSNWRNARANILAGGYTMLGKARAIRGALPGVWQRMTEAQRWRAVLYAYNAGEGSAIAALRRGGPNARMISTFTNPRGQRVSHDYTAEIQEKIDYVESHDPFDDAEGAEGRTGTGGTGTGGTGTGGTGGVEAPEAEEEGESGGRLAAVGGRIRSAVSRVGRGLGRGRRLRGSVGRGGRNLESDVEQVQEQLQQRGVTPGPIDGDVGPLTIGAIERFQQAALDFADGLISPGRQTEEALFGGTGRVEAPARDDARETTRQPEGGRAQGGAREDERAEAGDDRREQDSPSFAQISRNFGATIPGTRFTWHDAFWLPSWGRHVRASDVTNMGMDELIGNVERQAAALSEVEEALGRAIVVHCWVRPPAYNRRIGGAGNSAHLRGTATDFHVVGMSAERVRQAVRSRRLYPGAGENNVSWVHLDLEHRAWFNP